MIQRLLVCEFLHADRAAFSAAPVSLRSEGRQMLAAVLSDAARISDLDVAVLLCPEAAESLKQDLLACSASPLNPHLRQPFLNSLVSAADDRDAVLLIAPESEGCLLQLCRELRAAGHRVLLPPTGTVAVCSDKLVCADALSDAGLPVVTTVEPTNALLATLPSSVVLKPRFGCGCEGIRRCQREELDGWLNAAIGASSEFVAQPYCEGDWFSIAFIGCGSQAAPLILPLAEQYIRWTKTGPLYCGGRVPACVPSIMHEQARSIATAVASVIPPVDGYLGIDLFLATGSGALQIMEVNPRLCTSYTGYRKLTDDNLLSRILQRHRDTAMAWKPTAVEFTTSAAVVD
ncbi:MAG: ATP-grasp domain-containing protein [Planctomycetaceae bacterium]